MNGRRRRGGRRVLLVAAVVAVALVSGACRAEPAPASAASPASPASAAAPATPAASPAAGRVTVHLGDDPWTLLRAGPDGMRGLPGFDGADGMLFDFEVPVEATAVVFVMDRVAFPLDIAWFNEAGEPVGRTTMAVCPALPCPTYAADAPYRWAIEAPAGAFADLDPAARLRVEP